MVGWRGSNWLKLSKTICRRPAGALEDVTWRAAWTNAGSEGVVISRTKVGYSRVRMKMRVKVMMHSFFEVGGSGLVRIPKRPRTQGRLFCRVSQPPISMVALMSTTAAHLPWTDRSWSSVDSKVRYLWATTEASEAVLDPEA